MNLIAEILELLELFDKHTPETLNSELAEISVQMITNSNRVGRMRMQRLQEAYDRSNSEYERWKRKAHANNWLKMHGQPMKRRGV